MRAVADGWFISFTRVACCSFGQPEDFSHCYMGRIQEKTKGNLPEEPLKVFFKKKNR